MLAVDYCQHIKSAQKFGSIHHSNSFTRINLSTNFSKIIYLAHLVARVIDSKSYSIIHNLSFFSMPISDRHFLILLKSMVKTIDSKASKKRATVNHYSTNFYWRCDDARRTKNCRKKKRLVLKLNSNLHTSIYINV